MHMKYIFGLGNPGLEYKNTRHNVGFMVVDALAERHDIRWKNADKLESQTGSGVIAGQRVMLVKPTTFMNNSGWAVSAVADYYNVESEDMIVLYDDIDIAFGMLRIREKGSAGTHNGMRSVVEYLQSQNFTRVRIGIGKPQHSLTSHVLGKFEKEKRDEAQEMIDRAADAVECLLAEGIQKAQEKFQQSAKNGSEENGRET